MGTVIVGMTVSLDGFVNDRNGETSTLSTGVEAPGQHEELEESIRTTGAVVMGRRTYEMGNGDYTGYEFQVPIFVITHEPPATVAKGTNDHLTFTFVTEGPARAIEHARVAAGEKNVVVVGGASTLQQLLNAGLADELHVDIAPVLLGGGLRLFENLETAAFGLEPIRVGSALGPGSLRFRVTHRGSRP